MLRTAYKLPFRILGIPIHFDVTFLVVLPLIAWLIGSNIGSYVELFNLELDPEPLTRGATPYIVGLAAAVGLFLSILIHELGHSVVGQHYGIKIERITLWILGGMAHFKELPRAASAEAIMAIAGPVTSYALAALSFVLLTLAPPWGPVQFVLAYLMYMNVVLATFNLLPALPLDGGRVLRAFLATRQDRLQATQIAAGISRSVAVALGLLGFLSVNVFLILVALFIFMAAAGEANMAAAGVALGEIHVAELMTRDVRTVAPDLKVSDLADKMMEELLLGYPVVDSSGTVVGMVTLSHVNQVARQGASAQETTVGEVMSRDVSRVSPQAGALEAFKQIASSNFERLVVVNAQGVLVGIISKTDLVRAIQIRLARRQ